MDRFYPYPSGLLHWHWGNHTIAPVPVKQPWGIWLKALHASVRCCNITTIQQNHVYILWDVLCIAGARNYTKNVSKISPKLNFWRKMLSKTEFLHRSLQYICCASCKISEGFISVNGCYGQSRFVVIFLWDRFWMAWLSVLLLAPNVVYVVSASEVWQRSSWVFSVVWNKCHEYKKKMVVFIYK